MAMAPACRSSSSPKPPERTAIAGIPGFFAASTSHTDCQVRDCGHIADPLTGRRSEAPGHWRGRGLLAVNHLADLVRVHTAPSGATVEARFQLG
jgi:hypothetical protein